MDVVLYSLLKKRINGLASGVSNVSVDGSNLNFEFLDGSSATMTFPTPKDGVSIVNTEINEEGHLIITLSDNNSIDAGFVPVKQGEPGKDGKDGETPYVGANGNWWVGNEDTGFNAQGDLSEETIDNAISKSFEKIPSQDIADLFGEI